MDVSTIDITLSQIRGISALNPRFNLPPDTEIPALAASLKATGGPVQNLVVREHPEERDAYEVLIGRRRFLALQSAFDASERLTVDVFDGTDKEAELSSLSEQTQRRQLHPSEEVTAFAALAKQGFAPAEIARDFGCEERTVRQRLALGNLHPTILRAWQDGSLTRESVEAFTATPDQQKQVDLFDHAPQHRRNPAEIRRRLRGDAIRADHPMARFVTVAAYVAAGGRTDEDLFAEDAYLIDGAKLRQMAEARLDQIGQALIRREGWGWYKTEFDLSPRHRWRHAPDANPDTMDSESQRLDEIEAELVTLPDNAPTAAILAEERDGIEAKIWIRGVKSARRKKLGVWISIDHAAGLDIERGIEALPEPDVDDDQDDDDGERVPKTDWKLREQLRRSNRVLAEALRMAISKTILELQPAQILRIAIAGMCASGYGNITGLSCEGDLEPTHPLLMSMAAEDFSAAIALALPASDDDMQGCLSEMVSGGIALSYSDDPAHPDCVALIDLLLGEGLAQSFRSHLVKAFDADAFLKALPDNERAQLDAQLDIEGWLPAAARQMLGEQVEDAA